MGIFSALFGSKPKLSQVSTLSPEQQRVLNALLGGLEQQLPQGINVLSQLLAPSEQYTQTMQAPAMRQFQEEIIPSLAERFTGTFGTGAQRSNAFAQQLGQAGAGLAENLAAMGQQSQLQGLGQLQNLLSLGLGSRPLENVMKGGGGGLLGGLAPGIGQGLGGILAGRFGAPLS